MRTNDAIEHFFRLPRFSPPDLSRIDEAAERVNRRWPNIRILPDEKDQEILILQLKEKYNSNNWEDTQVSFVLAAASSLFQESRLNRSDLSELRNFLFKQTGVHKSTTFLSGIFKIYLETYSPGAEHTRKFAEVISANSDRFGLRERQLFDNLPQILKPTIGHEELAKHLLTRTSPYSYLIEMGIVSPHSEGFMEHVHKSLTQKIQSELNIRTRIDWYFEWLKPPTLEPWIKGAEIGLEALLHPWLHEDPGEDLRSYLAESMISMFGDIRMSYGKVWASVDEKYRNVLIRWLTKEDMLFFVGMVDQAQKEPMWVKRRNFWLKLYDEGIIDAAWVAFSDIATESVQKYLLKKYERKVPNRFGWQRARYNTSLLFLKIGDKIVVEGCHNYMTHFFRQDDQMAPKLFQEGYDCDEIRRKSIASKSHSSIDSWAIWVRDTINADIGFSNSSRPYEEVRKPQRLR